MVIICNAGYQRLETQRLKVLNEALSRSCSILIAWAT